MSTVAERCPQCLVCGRATDGLGCKWCGTKVADCSPPLDAGIARAVTILRSKGIETYESCQGGPGHSFPEPTIRFHGDRTEGFRAFAIAQQHALPVMDLRRFWQVIDGELSGPKWEMTFGWMEQKADGGTA